MGRVSQRQNGEKMRLGVKQVLTVVKLVDFGVYLGSDEERVLLPKKQVPAMRRTYCFVISRKMRKKRNPTIRCAMQTTGFPGTSMV